MDARSIQIQMLLQELEPDNELNIGLPITGVGSFRLSAFRQRGSISAVIRYIPINIHAFAELRLPSALLELIGRKRGLLLIVGSTGSGKSTTIASMLDYRNKTQNGHILTLEDQIEFLFHNHRSIVNQREISSDTNDLNGALKNALRQGDHVGSARLCAVWPSGGVHAARQQHLPRAEPGHQFLSAGKPPGTAGRPGFDADGDRLATAGDNDRRRSHAGCRDHAQYPPHFRIDRGRRHQPDQGSNGKKPGARLTDVRASLGAVDRGRRDHPGRDAGQCKLAEQPVLADQQPYAKRQEKYGAIGA